MTTTRREDAPQIRILRSARIEIEKSGILGLRVADVARGAYCSITLIDQYFGDRDGLLAAVLGELYDEIQNNMIEWLEAFAAGDQPLTRDDIVGMIRVPSKEEMEYSWKIRLQILAVSSVNPVLRAHLERTTRAVYRRSKAAVARVNSRMIDGHRFDERIFNVMAINQLFYYTDLMGEDGPSAADYIGWVDDLMRFLPGTGSES